MPNPNRKYDINFNALLDEECDQFLTALGEKASISKAHVVRQCIRDRYQMLFGRAAVCADGQACRCPHAHIYAPAPPPPDPDRHMEGHDGH